VGLVRMGKKRFYYIDILRLLACALITNSHFDGVYPWNISFGGCPGNCLFFMISGFLLANDNYRNKRLIKWYPRKVLRIYTSLWIVAAISIPFKYYSIRPSLFLFPIEQFWFIPSIVVLYLLYFLTRKYLDNHRFFLIGIDCGIYLILYLLIFSTSVFFVERHIIFLILYGYIAMFIGTYIYEKADSIKLNEKGLIFIVVGIIFLVFFLLSKLWISSGSNIALKLQFLTQIYSMGFSFCIIIGLKKYEDMISKYVTSTGVGKLLLKVSQATLEIYLIQYMVISYCKALVFPVNLVIIIIFLTVFGISVHILSGYIFNGLLKGVGKYE